MKNKNKFLVCGFLLFLAPLAFGQEPIEIHDLKSIVSTEMKGMEGQVCDPQICPSDPDLISFQRLIKDSEELYFLDLLSGKLKKITSRKEEEKKEKYQEESSGGSAQGVDWQLDWRPVMDKRTRQWYVFVGDGGMDNLDLYLGVVGEDTKIKLTDDGSSNFVDVQPKWSPDGKYIVFVSNRTGNGDIYLIEDIDKIIEEKATPKPPKQLTTNPDADFSPIWNPDPTSGYIAYTAVNQDTLTERRCLINLIDLFLGLKTFPVTDPARGIDYTRPSWDPTSGSYLSYFVSEELIQKGGFDMKHGGIIQEEQSAKIGLTKLELDKNKKLERKELRGEKFYLAGDVVPDNSSGPLWLTGSQYMMFVKSRLEQFNPIYVANCRYWERNLGKFTYKVSQDFKMPVDLSVEKDKIVFSCQEGKVYRIVRGTLSGADFQVSEYPKYELSRPELYKKFMEGKAKLGEAPKVEAESPFKWFLKPIVGKNPLVFLNRRITPMVLGVGVATYLLWPKKEERKPDIWKPPPFPFKIGFKINLGGRW